MAGRRLLVVDDIPAFGEFVSKVASDLGFEVEVTTDGHAFRDCYDTVDPTVVMVDLIMPDIDGMELLQWLAERETKALIIIVTGYSGKYLMLAKTLAEARGLGPVVTLIKPFKVGMLRRVLTEEAPAVMDGDNVGRDGAGHSVDGMSISDDQNIES